jgi:hypothetical protein
MERKFKKLFHGSRLSKYTFLVDLVETIEIQERIWRRSEETRAQPSLSNHAWLIYYKDFDSA